MTAPATAEKMTAAAAPMFMLIFSAETAAFEFEVVAGLAPVPEAEVPLVPVDVGGFVRVLPNEGELVNE